MTKFFDIFTGECVSLNLDFGRGMTARYEDDKRVAEANARAQAEAVAGCVMPNDDPDCERRAPLVKRVVRKLDPAPQPDADGWIPCDGKGFPDVARAVVSFDYKTRDGRILRKVSVEAIRELNDILWKYSEKATYPGDIMAWRPHVAADTWHPMSEKPKVEKVYEVRHAYMGPRYSQWKDGEWKAYQFTPEAAAKSDARSALVYDDGTITGWREVQA